MSFEFVGDWEGRWHVRDGRDGELTPTERKRFLGSGEVIPLTLRADGHFCHKGACEGRWRVVKQTLQFAPQKIDGISQEEMRASAERDGREFRLAFLFEPFTLEVAGDWLETPNDRRLLFVRYERVYGKN